MLLAVVASLMLSTETKSDKQNIPNLAKVWNVLELRILVAVSLFLQMLLIFLGNRRKYIVSKKLKLLIWFTYLSADWIATVALGILSKDTKDHKSDSNFVIMAIWAPFLLVHLGGPDTITAYSLEDNQLWPRHMLELVYQLAVAVYVVYRSWNTDPLKYVTVPIIIAGIIKYGEKTWSLRSGSSDGFRESILPPPDPGPNYAKFMDDYTAKKDEGYHVTLDEINETTPLVLDHNSQGGTTIPNPNIPDGQALSDGFKFYNIPQCLFADLIFSFQDHKSSQFFFYGSDWKSAFNAIEVELGLIYDMLYTKAAITYSYCGIFLKFVSFFCTLSSFIAFYFLMSNKTEYIKLNNKGQKHWNYDLVITFVLFIGAILLEIYAVIVLVSSSWVMNWLSQHKNWIVDLLYKFISICQICFKLSHTTRWSNQMSQFNLIRFCLKEESVKCVYIQKLLRIYNFFEKFYYQKSKQVSEELKELIFDQLKDKSEEAIDTEACKKLCAHKGDRVLSKRNCPNIDIYQSIKGVEFDQSILLWHIATDLCYLDDYESQNLNGSALQSCKKSQLVSNYMLYLLVLCPFLLPNGIGQIRFEDTCAEVDELLKERKYIKRRSDLCPFLLPNGIGQIRFEDTCAEVDELLKERKYIKRRIEVCKMILRVNTSILPSEVKGDRSKSVLFDACRLAKSLQSLETEENWSKESKWEMISNVWVEMLCHAASHCRGLNHAKQLSQGGELLTHVWLLMAHLGITEQFQISKGHVRVKLKLS